MTGRASEPPAARPRPRPRPRPSATSAMTTTAIDAPRRLSPPHAALLRAPLLGCAEAAAGASAAITTRRQSDFLDTFRSFFPRFQIFFFFLNLNF